ncbi:hypothetical protein EFA46_005375 [Halarchaeum sp. CBA1220]|uniref:hypothetical protein n=1 Tax=Halarchaeum sp. CBA1220 TaxID=1853682 RepID=UPI0011CD9473|nr:hypothetical protein [Halarchaeum sp. CBA1220]QLC33652.1 hypothetical protein EFA46_005375 [Halarchaeum sp. CBA1220]
MSDGSYERHRPVLPRTYHVYDVGSETRLLLGTPVVDALGAEPGDAVTVDRVDGRITLQTEADA